MSKKIERLREKREERRRQMQKATKKIPHKDLLNQAESKSWFPR